MPRTLKKSTGRKPKKIKLTSEQKEQKAHINEIRRVFTRTGFVRVPGISDKEITFDDATGDFDDYFLYENILVLAEYTISKSDNISTHLKKKKIIFDKILTSQSNFVEFLQSKFPTFNDKVDPARHTSQYNICIVYASKNKVDQKHKTLVNDVIYLDYPILKYFSSVADSVRESARNEFLSFLGFDRQDIEGQPLGASINYEGSILPEAHSNFDNGFKVVSFYVDPAALLKRAYVLRKDGWKEGDGLYQRMISKGKVEAIRKHLREKRRVFINNIVVTLPDNTKILDERGDTKNIGSLRKTEPVQIQLPDEFNSVGIIDGQHRVFAYHEGGSHDDKIKSLRDRQNLLVTGIIYPKDTNPLKRTKFEATLFLEINSNQTNAKSDLKHAIGLILKPFASASIGKEVINRLNETGPLFDQFERYFYDTQKLKTTSIVSYALVPIVKLQGNDSLFKLWEHSEKEALTEGKSKTALNDYIDFCANEINKFLIATRKVLPKDKWTPSQKVKGRILTTTIINGFIICLRKLIENNQTGSTEYYENKLKELSSFPFDAYRSSQYGRMATDIYNKFFA